MAKTLTPRFKLQQWSSNTDTFVYTELQNALKAIDDLAAIDRQGTLASRPNSGLRGTYYFATDNNVLYRDTGSTWVAVNDYTHMLNKPALLQLGTTSTTAAAGNHSHSWNEISGKPGSFTPSTHTHTWAQIVNPPALLQLGTTSTTAAPGNHVHSWNDINGKPTVFPPTNHTHDWGEVTGKPSFLQIGTTATTAAAGNHVHTWNAINGKPTVFPPANHTHSWGEVTGKPSFLQLGTTAATAAAGNHTHSWAQITGKPTTSTLDGITIRTGTGAPSNTLGVNGDIYLEY